MSANDRTGVGSGSAEWGTPRELFWAWNERYLFDYDPFASHENHLLPVYSTVEGTFVTRPEGPRRANKKDGLTFDWSGHRVFMNPPYSRGLITKCVRKAADERNRAAIIVALLPAATETRWFQELVLPYCHIDFLSPRVRYIDPGTGKPGVSPPSGSVLGLFRPDSMMETP